MTPQQFHHFLFIGAVLLSILGGIAAMMNLGDLRGRSRDASLDLYTRLAPFEGDSALAKKMVLVDIDEQSLQAIGQWPWPRSIVAELIDRINQAHPLAIGLDILMSEEDRLTPKNLARLTGHSLEDFSRLLPNGDAILGQSLAQAPTVMATNLVNFESPQRVFAPVSVAQIGSQNDRLLTARGALSPIVALQKSPGAGFVSIALVRDNIIRRVPLIAHIDQRLSPSFALEMLRVAQNGKSHIAKLSGDTGNAITKIKTGKIISTTDEQGFMTLHHGYSQRFTKVSAASIMADNDTWTEQIDGSFVVLGSSASGLKDIHSTPLEASLPGPFIHLQILHQILSGRHIQSGFIFEALEIVASMGASILLSLLIIRVPLSVALLGLGGIATTAGYGFIQSFKFFGYLGNIYMVLGLVLSLGLLVLAGRATYEEYRRRKLRHAFNQYLSPEMVRRIDSSASAPSLDGQTTAISVMFMDIRNFTSLTEALSHDPETLTAMINMIMDKATAIILDHGGTLDKYIGDALMAFWNAPLPQHDHALRAVEAAIALQAAIPEINADVKALIASSQQHQPDISIGVGVATGEAVVGNMGSRFRFSYSCIGDTVNLAARLEPFGKASGLPITVSAETAEQSCHPDLVVIDDITVRGKSKATAIASPIKLSPKTLGHHKDLIIARKNGAKSAQTKILKKLAQAADYPPSLIAYYRQ